MTITNDLRPLTISTADLYTANFFGMDETESDANLPLWTARMEAIAKRDGVDATITARQVSGGASVEVEGYEADEEGEIYDTAEYGWFDKASDEAWAAVNA